ncbi:NADP-dependent oxidoreductase domain-containing protein [Zopfochytrium polystomum]|nr:NADP-dependent oxidoreductase domain-containing protein [Zopfochytrium polystomum]
MATTTTTTTTASYNKPHVIFGTMTFGSGSGGRIADLATMTEILSVVKAHGHHELDTARMYCDGNTEEVLAQLGASTNPDFHIHTKAYPFNLGDHSPEKLKQQFRASLKALNTNKVKVFYLHAPDHGTPYEETLAAVQELYLEGTFEELGLSNYSAWAVMKIHWICKTNGYVLPTLYQGLYNALTRDIERELFPCLRDLNIRFYAYNPLCGGLLSGNYKFDTEIGGGARFDPNTVQGARYRKRYWNETYFHAVQSLQAVAAAHNISLVAVALRWLLHHSLLAHDRGDGVIIGASSLAHAKQNLEACEEGPLPKDVVDALDEAYEKTRSIQVTYFR